MWRRIGGGALLAASMMVLLPIFAAAFPVMVTNITFEGLDGVRVDDVREVVGLEIGDEVLESDLKTASQAIHNLGWFREVMPEVTGDGEIVFHLSEYPKIEKIEIIGNVNEQPVRLFGVELFRLPIMTTTKIKQMLRDYDIKKNKVLNRAELEAGLKDVIAEYNNRGYVLVGVGEVNMDSHLSIEFIEGRVIANRIEGPTTVPTSIAEDMIDLPLGEFLRQADIQRVLYSLGTSVYFSDVQVVPEPGAAADEVIFHWTLEERMLIDEPIEIDDITLQGVTQFRMQTVRTFLGDIPANSIDNFGLLQIVKGLYDLYQESGYLMVRLSSAGVENGVLDLKVEEGEISEILLSGNTTTRDYVVLRNLKIEAGDVLTRRALQTAYQRLNSFGYFGSVEVLPEWSDEGVRLATIVTERRDLGGMNGTLAVEPMTGGIVGELTINQKNLFGMGQNVSLTYSRGLSSDIEPMTSTWTLGYLSVASFPGFDSVGLDLYRSMRTIESDDSEQEYVTVGGEVAFDYPIADFTDASISYKHEDERLVGTADWSPIDSVGFAVKYDDLDDPYFPTAGNRQVASIEKAGGFASGEEYTKLSLLWAEFTPVRSILFGELDQTLALRLSAGWANEGLPVTQAFHLGGPMSIRGTETSQVSRMFVSNFEYRVKLTEGLVVKAFFDAGLDLDSVCTGNALASTGIEIAINVAGLFLRFDVAWVLGEEQSWLPIFDIGFGPMF